MGGDFLEKLKQYSGRGSKMDCLFKKGVILQVCTRVYDCNVIQVLNTWLLIMFYTIQVTGLQQNYEKNWWKFIKDIKKHIFVLW